MQLPINITFYLSQFKQKKIVDSSVQLHFPTNIFINNNNKKKQIVSIDVVNIDKKNQH